MNRIISSEKEIRLIDHARQYVLNFYNKHHSAKYVYHNYQLASEIVRQINVLAVEEEIADINLEIATIAGWFIHLGFLVDYQEHAYYSKMEAQKFLLTLDTTDELTKAILRAIEQFNHNHQAETPAEKVLFDAATVIESFQNFEEKDALRKLEIELVTGQRFERKDWVDMQWNKLLNIKLYSAAAQRKYGTILSLLIQEQKEVFNKSKKKALNELGLSRRRFADIEKRTPDRGVQTFFRSNYRNHINLSAIADNKANIMITVNSLLISVLITALTYRNITESNPMILLPVIIFLITGLASLIFAVLSARPKVTNINTANTPPIEIRKNIVFFGSFASLDLDQYEEAMDHMLKDGELLYGNMSRDLYFLGKVLDKKYRYLTVSYNVFMVGFIFTVTTFLFVILF